MSHDIRKPLRNRGLIAWLLALVLITFYVFLYWDSRIDMNFILESRLSSYESSSAVVIPDNKRELIKKSAIRWYKNGMHPDLSEEYRPAVKELKNGFTATGFMKTLARYLDPLSQALRDKRADKWFLYGFLYTLLIFVLGIRFYRRWKNEPYQRIRTASVITFQTVFAFIIPGLLVAMNSKEFYFHYFWPLKIEYFFPSALDSLPRAMFLWAAMMSFIAVPVLTYFYGKRWYCSWVCGCGALANTAGDDFRHLSSKTEFSWRVERITIYSVLVIAIGATALLFIDEFRGKDDGFHDFAFEVKQWYGFFISAGFAGVVGTGFYPFAGTRIWCRFGCPQAAILGILQRVFTRYRITVNGGQCIACGNCSTYCEMGIDVRAYAMRGEDIRRASCVGCGMCQSVCPRGVLKLENGPRGVKLG